MNKQDLIKLAGAYVEKSSDNRIATEIALSEDVSGMKMFDAPIFSFGCANDEAFQLLKRPEAIGEHFLLPTEWLPGAKTVISFFLPYTAAVRETNQMDMVWPSNGWLHGRIEGQALLIKLCKYLEEQLREAGFQSLVPATDQRFWCNTGEPGCDPEFTSNWSERHIAYVCGLGTFGLSRGLITTSGTAGRFGSIITELAVDPDPRDYSGLYDRCTMCGKCADNCPAGAISKETGKNHQLCSDFLEQTKKKHITRYACGKCQVSVPCESGLPKRI